VARVNKKVLLPLLFKTGFPITPLRLDHAGLNVHVLIQMRDRVRSTVYLEATCLTLLV
jgi:hypothetical protein